MPPCDFIAEATNLNYQFEFNMIAEACVGYSYKVFYECGLSLAQGPTMQDF